MGVILGAIISQFAFQDWRGQYRYHLWRWEADTLVSQVFQLAGVGEAPPPGGNEALLQRYFALTTSIRGELDQPAADSVALRSMENERAAFENDVERIIGSYVTEAIDQADLEETLPLFSDVSLVWPPVAFELTNPPQLLVESPRHRIERVSDTLLKADLELADIERIEARASSEETAALVVSIGGIAAYPAIVRENRTYEGIVETAAHEWVHHYLSFYPLGQSWGTGGDANALNETTANIAGRELARMVAERHPVSFPGGTNGAPPPAAERTVDFSAEMRALRLEVDALLAEGKVEEAEQLMDQRRQYFEDNGIYIRKINQAYFAFYGTYADSPQSSDPIGPRVEAVWEHTGDVGLFLKVMRDVTSVRELDRVMERFETNP